MFSSFSPNLSLTVTIYVTTHYFQDNHHPGKEKNSGKTFLKVAGVIAIVGVVILIVDLPVYFEVNGGLPLGPLRLKCPSIVETDSQLGKGKFAI